MLRALIAATALATALPALPALADEPWEVRRDYDERLREAERKYAEVREEARRDYDEKLREAREGYDDRLRDAYDRYGYADSSKVYDAQGKYNERLRKAEEKYAERLAKAEEKYAERVGKAQRRYDEGLRDVRPDAYGYADPYGGYAARPYAGRPYAGRPYPQAPGYGGAAGIDHLAILYGYESDWRERAQLDLARGAIDIQGNVYAPLTPRRFTGSER